MFANANINAFIDFANAISDSAIFKSDSLIAKADSIVVDSVRVRFIPGMGKILKEPDTLDHFHQEKIIWSDTKYLTEIIWKLPGFFYRDLGEAGKYGQLNAFGIDARGISIMMDGRPLNDPVTGVFNLTDIPLEFLDNAEVLVGSEMLTSSSNVANIGLNFITRSYNSFRPLTKIRFVQDPKGTLLTDGLYTQNIMRGLNLMIGFQRHVSEGRFNNANLDAWNFRARLRYNLSDKFNISLTEFYTKAANGLNSGVDIKRSSDIFDATSAYVMNLYASDSRAKHDLTLSTIGKFFKDSSSTTQLNLYYSKLEREYWDGNSFRGDSTKSNFFGIWLQQRINLEPFYFCLGGQVERKQSDSTINIPLFIETEKSMFGQVKMELTNVFIPSFFIRSTMVGRLSTQNIGINLKSCPLNWLTLFADFTWYDRFPTFQERFWKDERDSSIMRLNEIQKEKHTFWRAGFNLHFGENLKFHASAYRRLVKDPIVYRPAKLSSGLSAIEICNLDEARIFGITGDATLRWRQFEIFGVLTLMHYKELDSIKTQIPDIIISGEASYRDKFFNDKLDAKFGTRLRFHNRQQSMQFDPRMLSYIQYRENILGLSTTLDLFMILRIGGAHVALSLQNVLNGKYLLAPIYPMPDRHLRIGVHWVFID